MITQVGQCSYNKNDKLKGCTVWNLQTTHGNPSFIQQFISFKLTSYVPNILSSTSLTKPSWIIHPQMFSKPSLWLPFKPWKFLNYLKIIQIPEWWHVMSYHIWTDRKYCEMEHIHIQSQERRGVNISYNSQVKSDPRKSTPSKPELVPIFLNDS